jgi:predicted phosphoribosyltransferase
MALFRDRAEAGQQLAERLSGYKGRDDVLVLGLPRGGVPVAYEVAQALNAPLDVFLVRKLGLPGHEELAMGAIASGGIRILNEEVVSALNIPERVIEAVADQEAKELERRERAYRGDRPRAEMRGKLVILIDDGLATGSSMRAAVAGLLAQGPARIIVAVPTAPAETCALLAREVGEVVCLATPEPFYGVGLWYGIFEQTSDEEVRSLLEHAHQAVRSH